MNEVEAIVIIVMDIIRVVLIIEVFIIVESETQVAFLVIIHMDNLDKEKGKLLGCSRAGKTAPDPHRGELAAN